MSTASVSRAKQELISLNLITVQKKPNPKGGKAYDLITILNIWDLNIQKYDQVTHSNLDGEQVTHSNLASYSQKVKNNPSKEKPTNKNNPYVVIPLSLNTPQFIETWNEWVRYRKEEKKKPLTPTNQIKQLAYLENHRTEAIDILNRSMRNGWIGIDFKEKAGYTKAQPAQPLPQYAEEH